ncbi:N-acetylmuramoyl-L-alanine amidase [Streptomyces paludis]|uniref:N-acetylmuramoyl-L-alanine amidase n=1 Tax=Streptomyces paludis TaxID=2282738 RepID=A0A345HSR6_9ACTN|nr:peptidoglycan recognition family protein [Streptomyces paludis]AXG79740.1 N-acetylmuramoyl-L-alanine amidase [Streptomyces paludis]
MSVPPTDSAPATPEAAPSPSSLSRFSRRAVIGAAGAVAAAAVVTPVVSAATPSGTGPDAGTDAGPDAVTKAGPGESVETFPATRSAAATGERPVQAAFPIGHVGVRWSGPADGGGIRLRRADGGQGAWQPLSGGCSPANGGAALVAAGGAAGYQVRAPEGATGVRTYAIDTAKGPEREVAVPEATTRVRGVAYLSRAAWGADESKRFKPDGSENSPTVYYPFQTITVHHTDTANADPDPAATVRAIYEFHAIDNDWGDIGYHFLVDAEGVVYEGRYSGDDGVPAHDADGRLVTAFHVGGFNSGNLGIALLGNLMEQGPTDAARDALTRLVSSLARLHGLDPKAELTYVNPVNGVTKDVRSISGHRDWLATDCPGDVMYAELAALRERVTV